MGKTDFTVKDYMSGTTLPDPEMTREEKLTAKKIAKTNSKKLYYCGIMLTKRGPKPFATTKEAKIPENATFITQKLAAPEEVNGMLNRIFDEMIKKEVDEHNASDDISQGRIALFDDKGKTHLAIILDVYENACSALFLTSKTKWTKNCRRATNEELALLGTPSKNTTYLTRVIRPLPGFISKHATFPIERIELLKQEFDKLDEKFCG